MNVLSLFDGMSCGQIALNRLGITVDNYYASEVDKHAIAVTQANYPNTIQLGDITKWKSWQLPKIDLILAGPPCQGLSSAGKQLAFDDPRSALFWVFADIMEYYNPELFLMENVKMKQVNQETISTQLGTDPTQINSSCVSAQLRNRLYWTNGDIPPIKDKNISLNDIIMGDYYSNRDKSYCLDACYYKGSNFRRYFFCGSRQIVLKKGYTPGLMTKETANEVMHSEGNQWRLLSPMECERLQTVPEGYTGHTTKAQRYKMLGNGWTVDVIVHILKDLQ